MRSLLFVCGALLAVPVPAQEDAQAILDRALGKMATLPGVDFRTLEAQDNAMMRQIRQQMPGVEEEIEVTGKWCNGVTHASLNADEDEVIVHAGRAVARTGSDWRPRRDTLQNGEPLPFVVDPSLMFEALRNLPEDARKVVHSATDKLNNQELQLVGLTFEGKIATELHLSGAFPRVSGGMMMLRMPGGGRLGSNDSKVTVDVALWIDPATALVHRIRVKAYKDNPFAGQVRIGFNAENPEDPEESEEVEDDVKETDDQGNRIYKRGLPVRKVDNNLSMVDFDCTFTDHGKMFDPDLDNQSRQWLRLPSVAK